MTVVQPQTERVKLEEVSKRNKELINSEEFLELAKKHPGAFSRIRKLTFNIMFCLLINLIRSSIQCSMNGFWDIFNFEESASATQQAFSKARQNIRWEACKALLDDTVKFFYEHGYNTWLGYRVSAIDGSTIQLPADEKLKEEFGTAGRNNTSPTARGSVLFDVLNGIIIDARLDLMSTGERCLATEHLNFLASMPSFLKELALFDRGYPSFDLLELCESKNIKYLMRVKTKFNIDIDNMKLGIHSFTLQQGNKKIKLRVIKFILPKGEIETLITNLINENLSIKQFKNLYFRRWTIEVLYGKLKNKLELENFSSRTKDGINQEFYITAHVSNIIDIGSMQVQPIIDEARKNKNNKYKYKVNISNAVGVFKNRFVCTLFEDDPIKITKMIAKILSGLLKNLVPIRKGRSCPRNQNPRKSKFHHNRKSNC
jgi:hypothetical protein